MRKLDLCTLMELSCSITPPIEDFLRLLASSAIIIHSCRETKKRKHWIIEAKQINGDRENLRKPEEKWRIHVLFSTAVCSTNAGSENNLDVCAGRYWMRQRDEEEKPEKASKYTEAEDEQPDKLFPQEAIHNESEGFYRDVESQ